MLILQPSLKAGHVVHRVRIQAAALHRYRAVLVYGPQDVI